ncbi:MAG: radical SAM protein [Clostridiales bacterium]|nr:radical SAM protein [Clostridiales bacterium]
MFKKVYIEITNICNLNCKFCPETIREKQFMSIEEFEDIISKIHNYTKLVCLHVKGEPLLHNALENILKILDKYDLKANITTNGTLIKEKLQVIQNSKAVRQINFSIHSISQNEIEENKYLQDIFESVNKLENILISYRLWNMRNIKENDINTSIIKAFEKQYNIQNLKEKLMEKEFYQIKENVFINQDIEFEWPDINKDIVIKKGRCLALKEQIAILVDGTVVPCCLDNNGDISLGNIFEETLEDILNKDKTKLIKKNFENSVITCKLCKTCGFLKNLESKRKIKKEKNYV